MDRYLSIGKSHYNIRIIKIYPQPGGWASLAYRALDVLGRSYFLKVYEKKRAATFKLTAGIDQYAPILDYLTDNSQLRGRIPTPIQTKDGRYHCEDEHNIYMLFDFMEGETVGHQNLTTYQVTQLAKIIAELHIHGGEIPVDTDGIMENYEVSFLQELRELINKEFCRLSDDVQKIIGSYIPTIMRLSNSIESLSNYLQSQTMNLSLCHTDLHHGNLMVSDGWLMLMDWEGLKLAPVEADLMFLVDKPYFQEFLQFYQRVNSEYSINTDALRFYQGRRSLEDIWEFLEQLLYDDMDPASRAVIISYLKDVLREIG